MMLTELTLTELKLMVLKLMVLEDLELVLKVDTAILMLMAKVFKESQFNKPKLRSTYKPPNKSLINYKETFRFKRPSEKANNF